MTTIAILGVSRGVGLATAKEALKRGWHVRGLARNPAGGALSGSGITLLSGDARDPNRVSEVIDGADAVVQAIGTREIFAPVSVFSKCGKALLPAMATQGPRRLIVVSSVGVGDSWGHSGPIFDWIYVPLILGRIYADKKREEKLIKASGLDWTILRPTKLTNGKATGKYDVITNRADYRYGSISRGDVAHFICTCVETGDHIQETALITRARR